MPAIGGSLPNGCTGSTSLHVRARPTTPPPLAPSSSRPHTPVAPKSQPARGGGPRVRTPGSRNRTQPVDLQSRLWNTDQKLKDTQSKLTAANLELSRLRNSAEQHERDMSFSRRLLEREQREKTALQGEVVVLRDAMGKRGGAGGDGGTSSERVAELTVELQEAQAAVRAAQAEAKRQRDECEELHRALGERGNEGELMRQLASVRAERVRETRCRRTRAARPLSPFHPTPPSRHLPAARPAARPRPRPHAARAHAGGSRTRGSRVQVGCDQGQSRLRSRAAGRRGGRWSPHILR